MRQRPAQVQAARRCAVMQLLIDLAFLLLAAGGGAAAATLVCWLRSRPRRSAPGGG